MESNKFQVQKLMYAWRGQTGQICKLTASFRRQRNGVGVQVTKNHSQNNRVSDCKTITSDCKES